VHVASLHQTNVVSVGDVRQGFGVSGNWQRCFQLPVLAKRCWNSGPGSDGSCWQNTSQRVPPCCGVVTVEAWTARSIGSIVKKWLLT